MVYLAMRFTFSKDWNVGNVDSFVNDYLNSNYYVIGCESGKKTDKPHCHLVVRTDKKIEAIRKYLRSKGLKGNESFSIKNVKENTEYKAMAYCCKEDKMPCFGLEVSDSDIAKIMEVKNSYVEEKKEDKKKKLYVQVKDYVFNGLWEKVYNENANKMYNCSLNEIKIRSIVTCVMLFFKEYEGLYREFQVIAICQTLMLKELKMEMVLVDKVIDKLT